MERRNAAAGAFPHVPHTQTVPGVLLGIDRQSWSGVLEVSKDREAAWPLSVLSQVFWFLVWGNCSSLKFSAILTAASCVQCLGFLLLVLKARGKGQADTLALTPAGGAATRASCSSGSSSGATARA